MKKRIGIIGYGSVGQFIVRKILQEEAIGAQLELAFVWNRTTERLEDGLLPKEKMLKGKLEQAFQEFTQSEPPKTDLIIELAHPSIVQQFGAQFLKYCDFMPTSLTAFANQNLDLNLRHLANTFANGLYIPTGAAWGIQDILKMDQLGTLKALNVEMQFSAGALKLEAPLSSKLQAFIEDSDLPDSIELFHGPIRQLAPLAPNNVNTMTCLALAANTLGLDKVQGKLIATRNHTAHVVKIEVIGPDGFKVETTRINPAKKKAVTGAQTYNSFLSSILNAGGRGKGVFFV